MSKKTEDPTPKEQVYEALRAWGLDHAKELAETLQLTPKDVTHALKEPPEVVGKIFSTQEAAEVLGISGPSVRRLSHQLNLGFQSEGATGGARFLSEADVEKIRVHRIYHQVGHPRADDVPYHTLSLKERLERGRERAAKRGGYLVAEAADIVGHSIPATRDWVRKLGLGFYAEEKKTAPLLLSEEDVETLQKEWNALKGRRGRPAKKKEVAYSK